MRTDSTGPFYRSVRQIASFPYLLKETGRKTIAVIPDLQELTL